VVHISIWGIEAFSGVLSGGGTGILGPCDSVGPPWGVWSAADTALTADMSCVGLAAVSYNISTVVS